MAHYAFLTEPDEDGISIVTEVIVGRDEGELGIDWEDYYSQVRGRICKRCSYNTRDGFHAKGSTPFRMNFPGIGYTFHPEINAPEGAFLPPEQ